jgi:hypothetical protein
MQILHGRRRGGGEEENKELNKKGFAGTCSQAGKVRMYLIVGTSVRSIVGDRKLGRTGEVYLSPICQEQKEEEEQGGAETIRLRQSPTKQRRRAQWSKGDAPGEYGGPPVDLRIRKTWGGEPLVDPLTATDDYIWKKDWQAHVEAPPSSVQAAPPPVSQSSLPLSPCVLCKKKKDWLNCFLFFAIPYLSILM